ncbi:hypothetical protein CKF54_07640 [Psittacicella hinzii]|uniref:Uncharacterized protein n=1 Tax=Psittacicella hinzii TaxID=2028575 RepID=A0A3A1Y1E1_9GAMM|nr:hypothetical protein [Psittacicella hinzii]RIY31109.1 hypothetical protein CKF54_07640 [Psittacicella hinzii]
MINNPLTVTHKYIRKNFLFLFSFTFILGILYYFAQWVLNLTPTSVVNYLFAYFSGERGLSTSTLILFLARSIILTVVLSAILTVILRALNIDIKQILIRNRSTPENLEKSQTYITKFNLRIVKDFIKDIPSKSLLKTYFKVLFATLSLVITSILILLPFLSIIRASYDSSILFPLTLLIGVLVLLANIFIYVPWYGLAVTTNLKFKDTFILSLKIALLFLTTVALFLLNFFALVVLVEVAGYFVKLLANFVRLGLLGDLVYYSLSLLKYVYLISFSLVLYFCYIKGISKEEIQALFSEEIYKQDYERAKEVAVAHRAKLLSALNYQTKSDNQMSYKVVADNSKEIDSHTTDKINEQSATLVEEKAEKAEKVEEVFSDLTVENTSQQNDLDLTETISEKKESRKKRGFFFNFMKKKNNQPNTSFERTNDAQLQFDSDRVENNPFNLDK